MSRSAITTVVAFAALVAAVALSLAVGARAIPLADVWAALTAFDPSNADHLIVRETRMNRTLIGVLAGAALAVAGALMQSVTRNPLADPGLLGINAGASLAVVMGIMFAGVTAFSGQVGLAFLGAGITAVVVYLIGSPGASTGAPVRLALAGAAITAFLTATTYGILVTNSSTLNEYRFWVVGALAGRTEINLVPLVSVVAIALVVGFAAARSMEAIALGDDAASALGVRIGLTRLIILAVVTALAATATAAAGPIAFVGLAVPHVIRPLVGASLPWLMAASALSGGVLLLVCDVIGRVVNPPGEVAAGIMVSAVGGITFAVLARRMQVVEL